jgi:sugar-specific transcriptional regulator TrmB
MHQEKKHKIQLALEKIGLTEKEAQVYLTLTEIGEAAPSIIAKKAKIKRPTTYVILEQLVEKGLVGHLKKHDQKVYSPIEPGFLLDYERKKLEELEEVIPDLKALKTLYKKAPHISLFEGDEGIVQILDDSLTAKDEIYCWSNTGLASSTALHQYHPFFLKKKIQKKIRSKCLFTYDQNGLNFKKNSKIELREVYLVPSEKFPFENEINIYNDKISIISLKDKIGVIIQNQNIADTQRAIFNLGFEYAKLFEKDLLTKEDRTFLGYKK